MLKDKVVIITGANRGIGNAIAKKMFEHNANVYAIVRKEGTMSDSFDDWDETKSKRNLLHEVVGDVCDEKRIKEVIQYIYKIEGHIDVLVNNAGIMEDAKIGMISRDSMQRVFETNVFGLIGISQIVARVMKKKKYGRILNMASIVGVKGNVGQAVYSASKGAVISFTKTAAKELASDNILVNAIAPGVIETDLIKNVPAEQLESRVNKIALGKTGQPEDIAELAVFLASDNASYITGQIICVDGGIVM